MNNTLRWIKFESVMMANFAINGITAPKFNSFKSNRISLLDIS